MASQDTAKYAKAGQTRTNFAQRPNQEAFPALPNTRQNTQENSEAVKAYGNLKSDDLHQLRTLLDQTRKQLERAVGEHSKDRKDLETQITDLKRSLGETRKLLLLLQPSQDASEAQVKELVEDLYRTVEDWADLECGNISDLAGRTQGIAWNQDQQKMLSRHFTADDIELSKAFPDISTNIIMNTIFSFLFELCINEEKWCYGIKKGEEAFLNTLVNAVGDQDSATSVLLSNRWRAETYQALSNLPDRAQKQQNALKAANVLICSILEHFVNTSRRPVKTTKFQEKIVDKAFKLGETIKGSVTRYRFSFPAASVTEDMVLKSGQADKHRLIDAETGIEIEGGEITAQDDVLGKIRLCVFPAFNKVHGNGELVPMVKSLVVLEKARPVKRLEEVVNATATETKLNPVQLKAKDAGEVANLPKPEVETRILEAEELAGIKASEILEAVKHNEGKRVGGKHGEDKRCIPALPLALSPRASCCGNLEEISAEQKVRVNSLGITILQKPRKQG